MNDVQFDVMLMKKQRLKMEKMFDAVSLLSPACRVSLRAAFVTRAVRICHN